jgi:predicted transcriptional regulator
MNATESLAQLTADIVAAHVSHNRVPVADVAGLIETVHQALSRLGGEPVAGLDLKPATAIRASIKPDYLVSFLDGKRYKMLRRHLRMNGHTPESYRKAFGLPIDYPMVAANYAAVRRELAHKVGLGRKPKMRSSKAEKQ